MGRKFNLIKTDAWQLRVPADLSAESPLVVVPTVHPRGDRRIIRCAQVALDAGYRIHFVWLGKGNASSHDLVGETLLPVPKSKWARIASVRRVAAFAERLHADLWHIHDYYFLPVARHWSKKYKKQVLYDVHEYYGAYYSSLLPLPRGLKTWSKNKLESYQVNTIKKIGAANVVSPGMAAPFRAADVEVAVSPNYPFLEDFEQAPVVPFEDRRWKVLHIGTLIPSYGTELLVSLAHRSFERGLPYEFQMISRFPSLEMKNKFYALLRKYNYPDNITLLEPRPTHEMPNLIARAGFGLSLIAPWGQNDIAIPSKVYEHTLLGLVNVATDRPAQSQFIKENAVGAVGDESSPDRILDKMLLFSEDIDRTQKQLSLKSEEAKKRFTWEEAVAPRLSELMLRMNNLRR